MNGGVSRRNRTNGWTRRPRADAGYTTLSTWVSIKRASVRLSVDVFYSLLPTLKPNDSNPMKSLIFLFWYDPCIPGFTAMRREAFR
jgi:hypothetical protein